LSGKVAVLILALAAQLETSGARATDLTSLERLVAGEPENLRIAAQYRQAAIGTEEFDRSIRFLDKLAKQNGGPNAHISLALAYVDKVPPSGDIRRLYLGRDAMSALTKAIEKQPSVLAYYVRGLVNLYYNRFIFNRVSRGVADLQQARSMVTAATPEALVRRVYIALGDGHFKSDEAAKAREVWSAGLERFPSDPDLKERLAAQGRDLHNIVTAALYAGRRVDTSLIGLLPTP
jgi:hypothetical protein